MPGSNKASQPAGPVPDPVPVQTAPVLRPSITCQQTTLQLESRERRLQERSEKYTAVEVP